MKVYTSIIAWNKMTLWAALGGKQGREFTCFGRAHHEDGNLFVTDVYLVKQEGSVGGVDGDEADINRLIMELYAQGIEPDELRCWIHSHPGTGPNATYLSGTDDANIERYLTGQWLVSIVLDSKGENPFCQVDVKEPRQSIKTSLEVLIPDMLEAEAAKAAEEFKEKSVAAVSAYQLGKAKGGHVGLDGVRRFGYYADSDYQDFAYRGNHSWPHINSDQRGRSYSGPNTPAQKKEGELGKENGVAQSATSKGGADEDVVNTTYQLDIDGMLMLGTAFDGDEDEYDAWMQHYTNNEAAGIPTNIFDDETDDADIIDPEDIGIAGFQVLTKESVPEWVVSMADRMACTVEDLCKGVDVKLYDVLIDDLVLQVQCGQVQMDAAVEDLTKMGIGEDVAIQELNTRINA